MRYPFGQDFVYSFTPYTAEGDEILSIPEHTASLLVYTSEPSRSQVTAGSGALATYTKLWIAGAKSCSFSVSAIPDPDISGSIEDYIYWLGVKFQLKVGTSQIVIIALEMERPRGTGSVLSVTIEDLKEQFKEVTAYCESKEMLDMISIQIDLLKLELESRGFEWASIWRPDKLKKAVVFASLEALMANKSKRDGDQFDKLSLRYKSLAESFLKFVSIEVDANKNNEPDSSVSLKGYAVISR